MKTNVILTLIAALPLMAQEAAPQPAPEQVPAALVQPAESTCAKQKACCEARRAKFMEKFDTNKDGQIDEQEKEAIRAAFEAKRGGKHHGCRHQGPRPEGKCGCRRPHGPRPECKAKFMEKFDTNKDGQIDEQEKEAIRAEFEAKRAECKAKFMEKFDTNKDGQIDEQEKEAIRAAFEAKRGGRHHSRHHQGARPEGKCGCKRPQEPRPEGKCGCGCKRPEAPAPAPEAPVTEG